MSQTFSKITLAILVLGLVCLLTACSLPGYASADNINNAGGIEITYKITYVTNYGSAPVDTNGDAVPTMARVISEAPITQRSGYVLIGWYLKSDFSDSVVQFPYVLTENTTFYAKWQSVGITAISTVDDLKAIGKDSASMSASYYLANDIDLAGYDWIPIGLNYTYEYEEGTDNIEYIKLTDKYLPFTGSFDGNGFSIKNMTIKPFATEKEANYLPYGLFSRLGLKNSDGVVKGCTIKNLKLENYNISLPGHLSRFYLGALAGKMDNGTVTNCHCIGNVINEKIVYEASIWDDFFGSYAEPTERTDMGGLIGRVRGGTVTKCSAEGSVTSESVAEDVNAGGLVGCNENGIINGCYATSTVRARYAGGLVGTNCSEIVDCFAVANVDCSLSYPCVGGGLVGYNIDYELSENVFTSSIVKQSYSTGTVSARISGGLIGVNIFNYMVATGGIVNDCFSMADVFGSAYGGGLIGRAEADVSVLGAQNTSSLITENFFFIKNCISYGNVVVSAEDVSYTYIDDNGNEQELIQKGVYYSVFAGGLIGHAYEPRISGCIALGNVKASSTRPAGDTSVNNSTFADNFIGHSTNTIGVSRNVYAKSGQVVTRNGDSYSSNYSSAQVIDYKATTGTSISSSSFLISIGFSTSIWNLENISIEDGRYPVLR